MLALLRFEVYCDCVAFEVITALCFFAKAKPANFKEAERPD